MQSSPNFNFNLPEMTDSPDISKLITNWANLDPILQNILLDERHIPFVVGTQTVTTASWTGVAETIEELYDGLTIKYWLPRTSASDVTLNLTLKDGSTTGAIKCYYSDTSRLTTHFAAGNIILMTYVVNKLINGTAYTGWWSHAQYNTTYSVISQAEIDAGIATTSRVITAQRLKYITDKIDPNALVPKTTTFNANGSITENLGTAGVKTTTFNANGSITETLVSGGVTKTKTITFDADTVNETVS